MNFFVNQLYMNTLEITSIVKTTKMKRFILKHKKNKIEKRHMNEANVLDKEIFLYKEEIIFLPNFLI